MKRISSLAMSAVTALGLALTPMPAAADGEDIAKALAGIVVLGLIAKSVDDRRDRNEVARSETFYGRNTLDDRRVIDGEIRWIDRPHQSKRQGFKKRPLPERCLRIVDTGRRDRLVYGKRCLQRNFKFSRKLPEACKRLVRTDRGLRTVYGARCLRRDGWRVASR